jgi:hypothetical protein
MSRELLHPDWVVDRIPLAAMVNIDGYLVHDARSGIQCPHCANWSGVTSPYGGPSTEELDKADSVSDAYAGMLPMFRVKCTETGCNAEWYLTGVPDFEPIRKMANEGPGVIRYNDIPANFSDTQRIEEVNVNATNWDAAIVNIQLHRPVALCLNQLAVEVVASTGHLPDRPIFALQRIKLDCDAHTNSLWLLGADYEAWLATQGRAPER